jgi:hypothetical protein
VATSGGGTGLSAGSGILRTMFERKTTRMQYENEKSVEISA